MSTLKKILIDKNSSCKSIWFMRQAGRYLPEFREIRSKNHNFIKLCLNSELSSEITLQPIKKFNLDSAIIFSDILITPYALGQEVEFIKDQGPKLDEFNIEKFLAVNEVEFIKKLNPVYKSIEKTRKKLDKNKSLIAFIGAPWTLLVYMLDFKKNKTEIDLNKLIKKNIRINQILDKLIKFLCVHIKNQINAGADVVQIFDSWANLLSEKEYKKWSLQYIDELIELLKNDQVTSNIPVILFAREPKCSSSNLIETSADCISLFWTMRTPNLDLMKNKVAIQGNLNPAILLESNEVIKEETYKILDMYKDYPGYIFNLGHGVLPSTPIQHVFDLCEFIAEWRG